MEEEEMNKKKNEENKPNELWNAIYKFVFKYL